MMCRSVCRFTCLSSTLWKNGGSDPDAVRQRRSDRSRDETASGVWGSVHGKGYFWGEFVALNCPQGPTGRTCATAPRRGPLAKLLWADLLHISSCNMDRLNKIFNFVYSLLLASAGTGRDREQRTSPVQNSNSNSDSEYEK